MSKKRRQHNPELKAKVGLEALKGIEPVHADTGATFAEAGKARANENPIARSPSKPARRQQS